MNDPRFLTAYQCHGRRHCGKFQTPMQRPKVGNSVVRHHITRLLRESVRKNDALVKEGNRIIIVARKDVKNKNFKEVDGAVFHLLKIHGILK